MTTKQVTEKPIEFIKIKDYTLRHDKLVALVNFNYNCRIYGQFSEDNYIDFNSKLKITNAVSKFFDKSVFLQISNNSFIRYDAITSITEYQQKCSITFTVGTQVFTITNVAKPFIKDEVFEKFKIKI